MATEAGGDVGRWRAAVAVGLHGAAGVFNKTRGTLGKPMGKTMGKTGYPGKLLHNYGLNHLIFNGKTQYKWPFSIAM